MRRPPPTSTLFPYTTLFRSHYVQEDGYIHAVDLRTRGRSAVKNRLVQLYFWTAGLGTLRHESRGPEIQLHQDRKSTRLNSSHVAISYAVFCLKKKKKKKQTK